MEHPKREKRGAAPWIWLGSWLARAKLGLPVLLMTGAAAAAAASLVVSRWVNSSPEEDRVLSVFQRRPSGGAGPSLAREAEGRSPSLEGLARANAAGLGVANVGTMPAPSTESGHPAAPTGESAHSAAAPKLESGKNAFPGGVIAAGGALSSARAAVFPVVASRLAPIESATMGRASGLAQGARAAFGARSLSPRAPADGALRQAFTALGSNRYAASSQAGGVPYDTPRSIIGGAGALSAAPGGGPAAAAERAKTLPLNSAAAAQKFGSSPPTPPFRSVTPWQNAINSAELFLALAALLLLAVSRMGKLAPWIRYAVAGLAAVLGAAVIALGAQISGGPYGQTLQGNIIAAAGAGIMVAAALAISSIGRTPAKTAVPGAGINPYVWLGGGAALIAVAAVNLLPPR